MQYRLSYLNEVYDISVRQEKGQPVFDDDERDLEITV